MSKALTDEEFSKVSRGRNPEIVGTVEEVLTYMKKTYPLYSTKPSSEMKLGDKWCLSESLTYEKQLETRSRPAVLLFFIECISLGAGNKEDKDYIPQITMALKSVLVEII